MPSVLQWVPSTEQDLQFCQKVACLTESDGQYREPFQGISYLWPEVDWKYRFRHFYSEELLAFFLSIAICLECDCTYIKPDTK